MSIGKDVIKQCLISKQREVDFADGEHGSGISILMPHVKVTKRKEPFSIMNKLTDNPRNVTKPLNICSDFHPR